MTDWKPGDLLFFSGTSPISWGIRIGTLSRWSHVAGVAMVDVPLLWDAMKGGHTKFDTHHILKSLEKWQDRWMVFESTTVATTPCELTGQSIQGVQAHAVGPRAEGYAGSVWRIRLAPRYRLGDDQMRKLALGYIRDIGTEYDARGAQAAGTTLIKRLLFRRADLSSLFCAEMIAAHLQALRLLPLSTNPSHYTPASLYRQLVGRSGVYMPAERIA